MSDSMTVPTLSASGWERGIKEKADRLFSYFLVSQFSQSQLYYGNIKSLPYLIKLHPNNNTTLSQAIEDSLIDLFERYFQTVTANVSIVDVEGEGARQRIEIDVVVTENNLRYPLAKLLDVNNSVIGKVINQE